LNKSPFATDEITLADGSREKRMQKYGFLHFHDRIAIPLLTEKPSLNDSLYVPASTAKFGYRLNLSRIDTTRQYLYITLL